MSTVLAVLFWVSAGLLVYAQVGYGALLWVLAWRRRARRRRAEWVIGAEDPTLSEPWTADGWRAYDYEGTVSVIVAAYREESVIAGKVANLRALDWPADQLEIIVSCDGSDDATAERARAAGADLVLENPRGGKIRAQDAAVARATGDLLAFSDANSQWQPEALTALIAPFDDPKVGYVCGQVKFVGDDGTNQEGLYWRYEMALRRMESDLSSVTGGNGAIYATRKESYFEVDPIMGHDLSFPFNMVKRGWRAVYQPDARATEKMVPSIEGEFARKRRMMSHAWPIVFKGGMLSPRGYPPLYALMIGSHRVLRYKTPFLHLLALVTSAWLALRGDGLVYWLAFAAQVALLLAALAANSVPNRLLLVCRYYVLTTASLAAGLYDWLRHGTPAGWEPPEGTR